MLKIYNSVLKESLFGSPFAPDKHYIAPVVAAGLATGAGTALSSLLGGIFGSSSNSDANKTNLEVARMNQQAIRETNQMNYDIHQSDIAQQERMWKLQNEYNDPKNVVRRLKEANVNPATAYGNISTPASAMSVPGGLPMQAPTLDYRQQPYDPTSAFNNAAGAFQGAINAYNQSRLATSAIKESDERTHGITLDNEEKQRGMNDRLEYLSKMAKHEGFLGELAKTQLEFELKSFNIRQAMLGADYTMQLKQINLAQEQFNSARLQNELYKIQIAYAPEMNEAQLKQYYSTVNQIKAEIGLIHSNMLLTDAQREREIVKKTGDIIDNGMKGLNYEIQNKTKQYVIGMAKEELYEKEDLRFMRPLDWYQKHMGKAANYTITPGTAGAVGEMMDRNNSRDRFGMQHNEKYRPKK